MTTAKAVMILATSLFICNKFTKKNIPPYSRTRLLTTRLPKKETNSVQNGPRLLNTQRLFVKKQKVMLNKRNSLQNKPTPSAHTNQPAQPMKKPIRQRERPYTDHCR